MVFCNFCAFYFLFLREFFLLFLWGLREMESGRVRLRGEICFWDERERGKVRGYIGRGGGELEMEASKSF
jgi:hypothetical protein